MKTLGENLGSPFFQRALLESVLVGAVAGVVGVHVLLRRLSFFVVAMSHATFPGVVLASAVGMSLFVGGAAFGILVVIVIVALGAVRGLDDSSAIGVVLAGAFSIGLLVLSARPAPSKDLSAFLVGQILTVSAADVVAAGVTGLLLLVVLAALHKELVHGAFDPAGLGALGYPTRALEFLTLVVVTVALVTAVPAVGTLLAVALLVVPALAARQWVDRIGPMMAVAALIGASSSVIGLCLSALWNIAAGSAIALTASAAFSASLVARSFLNATSRSSATA